MKLKRKTKLKSFIYFSITVLVLGTLVTFITVFFNKPLTISQDNLNNDDSSNSTNQETTDDEFTNLDVAQTLVEQTNISLITYYDSVENQYYFGNLNFQDNIFTLLDKAISLNSEFNDEIENYSKNLKYAFSKNFKEVTINLYLYNKLIKQKKFKSFFKLIIQ